MMRLKSTARALVAGASIVTSIGPSLAADAQGRFAAKSYGLDSCSQFAKAWDKDESGQADLRDAHTAWVGGYLTGVNHHMGGTFDIASWRSTRYLTASIAAYCQSIPDQPVMSAAQAMIKRLSDDKLSTAMTSVAFGNGAAKVRLYDSIYNDMRAALVAGGYLKETAPKDDAETISKAIGQFQMKQGIAATGLPDEVTLYHLLGKS
ncbi:MAG: hypothetical protein AAF221_10675 [Pseudomonadota bacterium]